MGESLRFETHPVGMWIKLEQVRCRKTLVRRTFSKSPISPLAPSQDNPNLGLHRIIRQGSSARDFVPVQSFKSGGILYVFPVFETAEMVQKIRRNPLTQLCGVALVFLVGDGFGLFVSMHIGLSQQPSNWCLSLCLQVPCLCETSAHTGRGNDSVTSTNTNLSYC